MKMERIRSVYVDRLRGQVPVELSLDYDIKKDYFDVRVKPVTGFLKLPKASVDFMKEMGKVYVSAAHEEMRGQAARMGMTNFLTRFPLVSIALQDPNLYLSNLFTIYTQGLMRRNIPVLMAIIDTAYKANEGTLPDPLPKKLVKRIQAVEYKKWGKTVINRMKNLVKEITKPGAIGDPFSKISSKDLESLISVTRKVALFYSKKALKK